jgi:hypothetical protein
MKAKIKIVKFWVTANYNQIFIILFLLYFVGQIIRILI